MKNCLFTIFCLIPTITLANSDTCLLPQEYTIDKRCYVTDSQKQIKPFNSVVLIIDAGCSGTIVKNNDKLYVYTAKHCTDTNYDGIPDTKLTVQLQDKRILNAIQVSMGEYEITTDTNQYGDWAIYLLDTNTTDIPYVNISQIFQNDVNNAEEQALSIGYGKLKIMSDTEIDNFKNLYVNYLQNQTVQNQGFYKGGINTNNELVQNFVATLDTDYYIDIFANDELKQSRCTIMADGSTHNCQTWHGDSGGGVFDNNGNIMRITTRGRSIIGGESHAGKMKFTYSSGIDITHTSTQPDK